MTKGIIYYNVGTKCLIRLCVSLNALREVYNGPVTVICDNREEWLTKFLKDVRVDYIDINEQRDGSALVRKSQIWKYTPYDHSVFMDADTICLVDPSPLFDVLDETEFFTTEFCGWKTDGRRIRQRIEAWEPVIGKDEVQKAIKFGPAVNTGVFGFRKNAKILPEWDKITVEGDKKNCTKRIVDEIACQVLLHKYPCKVIGREWNCSCKHDRGTKAKIYHYHGSKHVYAFPSCDVWKEKYLETKEKFEEKYPQLIQPHGDRRFKRWYSSRFNELTIVTAVNDKYYEKFAKNWKLWNEMPFFQNRRVVVFYNSIDRRKIEDVVCKHFCVDLIPWEFPVAGDNVRERMLSSFVFGTAKHVDSEYWMKLDCDCTPKEADFQLPDYKKWTILGHKWMYTKVKGDPDAKKHWLNTLDEWWEKQYPGSKPVFEDIPYPENKRHSHKRICSFVYFENTQFTRKLAEMCEDRLPVPSQDTTAWYAAYRIDPAKIGYTKFKGYWSP